MQQTKHMYTEIQELQKEVIEELTSIDLVPELDGNRNINCTNCVEEWLDAVTEYWNKQTSKELKAMKTSFAQSFYKPFTGNATSREFFDFVGNHLDFEYDIVKNASGYITERIFKYNKKAANAQNKVFKSIKELKEFLNGKKYLLYMIVVSVQKRGYEKDSFVKQYDLETPNVLYTFRGYII